MDASITSASSNTLRVGGANAADRSGHTRRPATSDSPSSVPQLVRLAEELMAQGPPVDYARIAQVRAAIASRTYEIDLDAIASAMLANQRSSGDDV